MFSDDGSGGNDKVRLVTVMKVTVVVTEAVTVAGKLASAAILVFQTSNLLSQSSSPQPSVS